MNKQFLILAVVAAMIGCKKTGSNPPVYVPPKIDPPVAQADFSANPIDKAGYVLTKNDEFNGSTLDQNLWIPFYLRHRVEDKYAKADYIFRDGALVLQIPSMEKLSYGSSTATMRVSGVQTMERADYHKPGYRKDLPTVKKFTQKYGYFEIRAKVQGGTGHCSTFWMAGIQDNPSEVGEIDIMEKPGSGSNTFKFNLYRWGDVSITEQGFTSFTSASIGGGGWSYNLTTNRDVTKTFNIYGLEWTPTEIKMYFNNTLMKTIPKSPQYPMGFFLTLYQGNNGTEWFGDASKGNEPYPKEYAIDYFRAFQKVP